MSSFETTIEVGDLDGRRGEAIDALVGTGATYTSLPREVLARLGVQPEERRPFVLAHGQQVEYPLAWIRVGLEGRQQPTPVIFGDAASEPLLGAFTLEGFGLAVDPVNRRVVPAIGHLVVLRGP